MSDDSKLPIIWRREPSKQVHLNYESDDGRWKILHPRNAPSNRWELYDFDDNAEKPWRGDFRSLNAAKSKAQMVQRLGR